MTDDPRVPTPDHGLDEVKQEDAPVLEVSSSTSSASAQVAQAGRKPIKRQYSGKKETMNGPLYMQASNNVVIVRRLKRNGDGVIKQLTRWFVNNQIGTSVGS